MWILTAIKNTRECVGAVILALILLMSVGNAVIADAATIYMSTQSNDQHAGTAADPVESIEQAVKLPGDGDGQLRIATGVYREYAVVVLALILLISVGAAVVADGKTIYVSTQGNDQHAGTAASPVKSIEQAIKLLGDEDGQLCIATGVYHSIVQLKTGITIRGGYNSDFSKQADISEDIFQSNHRSASKYPGQTVITSEHNYTILAEVSQKHVTLNNLVIIGSDLSDPSQLSSYGIYASGDSSSQLLLDKVKIIAGKGARGKNGETGKAATGHCIKGGAGGTASYRSGHSVCYSNGGAAGTSEKNGELVIAQGGKGGSANGYNGCAAAGGFGGSGANGGNGSDGQSVSPEAWGTGGKASTDTIGSFVDQANRLLWRNTQGGTGEQGWGGSGGGGGGAGQSRYIHWAFCSNKVKLGGAGGNGGDGGCGGNGGGGGFSGSASIAIAARDIPLVTNGISIIMGTGGTGGKGAAGGPGHSGTTGNGGKGGSTSKCGLEKDHSGGGGKGGRGGSGGTGGGGAGGNGGPSFGIALLGDATVVHQSFAGFSGGTGGLGGQGYQMGTAGLPGAIKQTHQLKKL